MKDIMMGDCRTDCHLPSGKKEMKEGDYLRMRASLDEDDETTGCMSMFRPRSSSHSDNTTCRSKSTDNISSTSSHSKFTEKVIRLFRSSHSDHVVESKQKLAAAATAAKGGQPPRRRYMRVVADGRAPPPDKPSDNPNIITHYSQEFLKKYYDEKRVRGDENILPYIVSDTSILKKSSTDPTSDRRAIAALESTIGACEKHATFNDVVTVFDTFQHTVTKERLHGSVDSDEESADSRDDSGDVGNNFFLESDSMPVADTSQSVEEVRTVEDSVDGVADVGEVVACPTISRQPQAMQNIFATFAAPPDLLGNEAAERRAAPAMRKVDLKSVVEQSLANGGGLRDE